MKTKKALSILTKFTLLVTILFTLTTCKKKAEDNPQANDTFLISPKAKFIVDNDWQSMIQSIDSTNYTLTFDKGLLSKYSLSQGDLMVSSVGNGLLRKIDTITQSGNNIQIQTSQATLTDLIQQGDIDFRSSLLTSGIKSIKYYYPGVHLDTANLKSTNGKLFSLDINTEIAPLILLSGNFQCMQDFIFQIQIGLLDGLKKVKFGIEGTESFDLTLTTGKEFAINKEITLATVNFIPIFITIPVPPFEIVVVPVFDIKLGLDGSAGANISTSLSQSFTLGTGVQYLKDGGWSSYKSVDKSINYTPPQLTMNASAEAYIKPELRMLIYNVVGPYLNGKGYGKIEADLTQTPWWKMYYGIKISGGAKATILNKVLFDFTVDDLLSWEQLVGQATGTSSDTVPTITTNAISNITDTTATGGGNVTSDGGTIVTARGICWGTSSNPTTAGTHTTDGSGTGSFTSILTGLTFNTPYYVRAYATNKVGTAYGNEMDFTTSGSFYIGQSYGGGIIFYLNGTGQHGLIVAPMDQSQEAEWGCFGTLIGSTGTAIGTGQANTTAFVSGCTTIGDYPDAARICDYLMLNGYNDWFLPSKDELNQMYLQQNVIGGSPILGGWSSSEYDADDVWVQDFSNGYQWHISKGEGLYGPTGHVRAIRAF